MISIRNQITGALLMMLVFTFPANTAAELTVEKFEILKSDGSIKLRVHGDG